MAPKVFPTAISLPSEISLLFGHPKVEEWETFDIPHAREQLHQTTVSKGKRDDDVGLRHPSRPHVDQTQDESGEGESGQSQRGRVGEFPILHRGVGTGLELTAKGRQPFAGRTGVDVGQRTVAEPGGRTSRFVFLVAHVAGQVVAVARVILFGDQPFVGDGDVLMLNCRHCDCLLRSARGMLAIDWSSRTAGLGQ